MNYNFQSCNFTRRPFLALLFLALIHSGRSLNAESPQVELLWADGAPGALGKKDADQPKITIYLPEKKEANGTAVVIFPGGGYGGLAVDHEGHQIARRLNLHGIAGFIVDYRHRGKGYKHPAPLLDAQRAIRTVRARAGEWRVNPEKIGVIGFSAGGHLASTTGTHFDSGNSAAEDKIDRAGCRPDFMILCYPVIAFDEPYTHRGSQRNLIGEDAPTELIKSLSNEKQVTSKTPPTFLFHTNEDKGVPPENSIHFYLALRRAGVPAELHVFEKGRHGVGLAQKLPATKAWPELCIGWLKGRGLLDKEQ